MKSHANFISITSFEQIIIIEKCFSSAVHRKFAFSVSFCVRKVDFPALVQENFKCAEN